MKLEQRVAYLEKRVGPEREAPSRAEEAAFDAEAAIWAAGDQRAEAAIKHCRDTGTIPVCGIRGSLDVRNSVVCVLPKVATETDPWPDTLKHE